MSENKVYGIRFHGRGGQGAVTAAQLAVMAYDGPAKCFPVFGAERMGAPTAAFARLSPDAELIQTNEQVYTPQYVCVLDDTLLRDVCVTSGTAPGAWVILNTNKSFDYINEKLGPNRLNLAKVDATDLAMQVLGRPITNTAILGALVKIAGLFTLDQLNEAIRDQFKGAVADKNIDLVQQVYEKLETTEPVIEYDETQAKKLEWSHIEPQYIGSKDVPIGAAWYTPGGSEEVNTGGWGVYRIEFSEENCSQCQNCYFMCPDQCILREESENGTWKIVGTDEFHCKGCRLCVEVCPGKKGVKAREAILKE
jgi:2-oxoacid:acceptor oxidoreductase gamma subunit (pyruvate/2-ketoisovalerate family)/2-oxoacid:acceptor oxidoreductase delta subunit (pyruvate/2-ketoisovalerate family)